MINDNYKSNKNIFGKEENNITQASNDIYLDPNLLPKIRRSNSVPTLKNNNDTNKMKKKSYSSTNLTNEIKKDLDLKHSNIFDDIKHKKENKKQTFKQKGNMLKFLFKIRK
jgi:hypothetical protein